MSQSKTPCPLLILFLRIQLFFWLRTRFIPNSSQRSYNIHFVLKKPKSFAFMLSSCWKPKIAYDEKEMEQIYIEHQTDLRKDTPEDCGINNPGESIFYTASQESGSRKGTSTAINKDKKEEKEECNVEPSDDEDRSIFNWNCYFKEQGASIRTFEVNYHVNVPSFPSEKEATKT